MLFPFLSTPHVYGYSKKEIQPRLYLSVLFKAYNVYRLICVSGHTVLAHVVTNYMIEYDEWYCPPTEEHDEGSIEHDVDHDGC